MSDSEEGRRRRFELLLLDYEMARDDDRSALGAQATMFGIGVALLAILIPLLTQTCALNPDANCTRVPVWIVAAAPMAPFGTIAFLVSIGIVQTIRAYYLRAIEIELQGFVPDDLSHLPVSPASLIRIVTEVISLRRGRPAFRLLMVLVLTATIAIFGGMTVYIIVQLPLAVALVSGIIYSCAGMLMLVESLRASIGGRGLFLGAVRGYLIRRGYFPEMLPSGASAERSLLSYLVLPRPRDVVKWLIVFAVYGYALIATGKQPVRAELFRVGALFFIFEYLIYEARYQWNDIRGLALDVIHPAAKHRLPSGMNGSDARRNVTVSEVVIVVRILAAIGFGIFLGHGLLGQVLLLLAIVSAVAVAYEWLRSRSAAAGAEFSPTWSNVAIWSLVGFGYALRGTVGLASAGMPVYSGTVMLAMLAFAAFGIVFVTMTWVLDGSSYCYENPAAGRFDFMPALLRQPQLASLLPFLGGTPGSAVPNGGPLLGADVRALRAKSRIMTPWNLGLLWSGAFVGAFGLSVVHVPVRQPWANMSVASGGIVGLLAVLPLILAHRSLYRWLIVVAAAVFAGVTLWPLVHMGAVLVILPWVFFAAVYSWFRGQSWTTLQAGPRPVINRARRLVQLGGMAFVGERTAALMAQSGHQQGNIKAGSP